MAMVKETKLASLVAKMLPYRLGVQSAFLLVWLTPGLRLHSFCGPVFHCYACPLATFACPIGVIAQFSALHILPFMAIGLLVAIGALLGSALCGWACPFGLVQDLAAKVPAPRLHLPAWTGYLRYAVLAGTVIAIPYLWGEGHPLFVCRVCPAGGLEAAVPAMVTQAAEGKGIVWPNPVKLTIVVVFLIAIFFVRRPWCRLLCPLGAIFSLFNQVSAVFLRVDSGRCTQCKQCRKLCPYEIHPDQSPNDLRCIRCLECTRCGPKALKVTTLCLGS